MKTENKTRYKEKSLFKFIDKNIERKAINRESFCGSINNKIDPLVYQRKMRNDWK